MYLGDANQQAAWEALFTAFNEADPDISIKANGIAAGSWGNYVTTVATQLAGGQEYDIVYVATEGQRLFASRDVLFPLDDYIAADQEVIDDYFADVNPNLREWTVKYGSPDGQTYYIPGGYNTMVMYCNTEVFEEAGVELPETDWTWDEFREAGSHDQGGDRCVPPSDGLRLHVRPDHAVAAHERRQHDGRGLGDRHVQLPRRSRRGGVREASASTTSCRPCPAASSTPSPSSPTASSRRSAVAAGDTGDIRRARARRPDADRQLADEDRQRLAGRLGRLADHEARRIPTRRGRSSAG